MDKQCNSNEVAGQHHDEGQLDAAVSSGSFNGPFWPQDTASVDSMNAPIQRIGKLLVNGLAASIGEGRKSVCMLCFNAAAALRALP